jgi:beta-galactosidase/beta-glucuronidase
VSERYNHPSIILWVVFNEAWGQHDTVELVEFTRSLDSTRIITGLGVGGFQKELGLQQDYHGLGS